MDAVAGVSSPIRLRLTAMASYVFDFDQLVS
jgi:hypothetical protein